MPLNISEFKSQLVFDGARPSLFQVQITNPVDATADLKSPFMIKAASFPASTIGKIEVGYFGRKIPVAGDRTFEDWNVTVINDEDFLVRNAMESWMNSINTHATNRRNFESASPLQYKTQAQITQFSKTGAVLREYTFEGLFPINISAIETNWDTTDTIEEFNVTFAFDLWTVTGGITGDAGTNS